jgi:hypothetical protein
MAKSFFCLSKFNLPVGHSVPLIRYTWYLREPAQGGRELCQSDVIRRFDRSRTGQEPETSSTDTASVNGVVKWNEKL